MTRYSTRKREGKRKTAQGWERKDGLKRVTEGRREKRRDGGREKDERKAERRQSIKEARGRRLVCCRPMHQTRQRQPPPTPHGTGQSIIPNREEEHQRWKRAIVLSQGQGSRRQYPDTPPVTNTEATARRLGSERRDPMHSGRATVTTGERPISQPPGSICHRKREPAHFPTMPRAPLRQKEARAVMTHPGMTIYNLVLYRNWSKLLENRDLIGSDTRLSTRP